MMQHAHHRPPARQPGSPAPAQAGLSSSSPSLEDDDSRGLPRLLARQPRPPHPFEKPRAIDGAEPLPHLLP